MPDQQPTVHEPVRAETTDYEQPRWMEEDEPLPPRPRRRLLTPLPLSLAAVLLIACGFIGGVLVEKGQGGSSSTPGGGASAFASRFRAALAGGTSASTGATAAGAAATGAPGGASAAGATGGFARPTSGTVAYLSGKTLYVTGTESNTIKVQSTAGTTVTKTVTSAVKDIHPGETVTVTGSTAGNGTVTAESIRVGSSGGLSSLFGGTSAGGKGSSSSSSSSSSGPALFGNG